MWAWRKVVFVGEQEIEVGNLNDSGQTIGIPNLSHQVMVSKASMGSLSHKTK